MVNKEIYSKLKKIKKELEKDGKLLDVNQDDTETLGEVEGPDFGPRNDIEHQKLIKEIRTLDDEK